MSQQQLMASLGPQDSYGFVGGKGSMDTEDLGPVSSEWECALRKHKIIGKATRLKTVDQKNSKWRDQQAKIDVMDQKTLEELDEIEDDVEESTLMEYRRKRFAELQEAQSKAKYGTLRQISEPEYKPVVADGSKDTFTICCLFIHGDEKNKYFLKCLENVARRHSDILFTKIIAQQCIHGYPDKYTPTLLIYQDCDIKGHIKGTEQWGGSAMTADMVEWNLSKLGCFKTDQDEDPLKKIANLYRRGKYQVQSRNYEEDDSDDDSLDI